MDALLTHIPSNTAKLLSWLASGIVAFFCLALAQSSPRSVGIFASMFQQLGVELPWPTRLLMDTYTWLLPLLFIAMAAFVIGKEFLVREIRRKLVLTTKVFLATLVTLGLVIFMLYLPLLNLAKKLVEPK